MADPTVARIEGFALAVRDPEASARFYCEGLGFAAAPVGGRDREVRLADAVIRLVESGPGAAAPPPSCANASDFQHFAIRVADMAAAFARLSAFAPEAISQGGPQRLPPADGSVTAWKFRDPDGHALELLQLSPAPSGGPLFEAVDHTAVACSDLEASLAFYAGLGFSQGPSSHNHGPAQDRLDGLTGVDLRIATVHAAGGGPHIELLHYLEPPPPPPPPRPAVGAQPFIRTRMASAGSSGRLRDPDGHVLDLVA